MPLELTIIDGPNKGAIHRCEESGSLLVGRSRLAHISLRNPEQPDRGIAKRHALIEFNSPRCRIYNLSREKPILLNGDRIRVAYLNDGDLLSFSKSMVQVKITPHPQPPEIPMKEMAVLLAPPVPVPEQTRSTEICPMCWRPVYIATNPLCSYCEMESSILRQPLLGYRLVQPMEIDELGPSYTALSLTEHSPVTIRTLKPRVKLSSQVNGAILRELKELQQIDHRHIHRLEEVGVNNHLFYMVSKPMWGLNLVQFRKTYEELTIPFVIGIICQVLSTLRDLHRQGIVHGDIHPRNIVIRMNNTKSFAKLMDVGIDRIYRKYQMGGPILASEEETKITFRAPEQIADSFNATPASDQYNVGALLYYLLTGHRIYKPAKARRDQLIQKLKTEPVPIRERRPDLPSKLISAIHCALAYNPKRRFASVEHFRAVLKSILKK